MAYSLSKLDSDLGPNDFTRFHQNVPRMKLDRPSASSSASHSGIPSPESQTTPEEVVVVSRGGSPVLALNGTSSSALEAMDLSLPQLRRRKSLDKGYDGEIRREPKGEQEIARGLLQKSYLSGELVVVLIEAESRLRTKGFYFRANSCVSASPRSSTTWTTSFLLIR